MRDLLRRLSPIAKGFLGAVVGMAVVLVGLHLYQDHLAFHAVLNFVNSNAQKIQKLP